MPRSVAQAPLTETPPVERKLVAILAADVEGYSRLMHEDEEATLATLSSHRAIVDSLVQALGGRISGTAGDSVLAEFASVVDAVRCAVGIQQSLFKANGRLDPERRMQFRIGINVGDVILKDGDLFGDGITSPRGSRLFRVIRSWRTPGNADLLLLDGKALLANIDLDAGRLLLPLIKLMAKHPEGYSECTDDGVEDLAEFRCLTWSRWREHVAPLSLFSSQRIFESADGVLDLAFHLVGLAFRLQLGIPHCLADHLLDCAFDLLRRSGDSVLVHDSFSNA